MFAVLYQAYKIKKRSTGFVNKNFGQMGWSLPAAVGANVGNGKKERSVSPATVHFSQRP
jgi:thiamine pyrophosphate-dependent acetolactate synthase large subunit-like protein